MVAYCDAHTDCQVLYDMISAKNSSICNYSTAGKEAMSGSTDSLGWFRTFGHKFWMHDLLKVMCCIGIHLNLDHCFCSYTLQMQYKESSTVLLSLWYTPALNSLLQLSQGSWRAQQYAESGCWLGIKKWNMSAKRSLNPNRKRRDNQILAGWK